MLDEWQQVAAQINCTLCHLAAENINVFTCHGAGAEGCVNKNILFVVYNNFHTNYVISNSTPDDLSQHTNVPQMSQWLVIAWA